MDSRGDRADHDPFLENQEKRPPRDDAQLTGVLSDPASVASQKRAWLGEDKVQ